MPDDIEIKIATKGDTKGAKAVSKEMKEVDNVTKDVTKSNKKLAASEKELSNAESQRSGESKKLRERLADYNREKKKAIDLEGRHSKSAKQSGGILQRNLPTFTKLGGGIKGMAGHLAKLIPGWGAVAAVAFGAIKKIVGEYKKWEEAQQRVTELYKESQPEIRSQMVATTGAQERLNKSTKQYSESQAAAAAYSSQFVAGLLEKASATEAVRKANEGAEKAEIDLAVATGKLTIEQGAQKKAAIDSASAEADFAEKAKLSQDVLEARRKELERSREDAAKARNESLTADADVNRFEGQIASGDGALAAGIDPKFNDDVSAGIERLAAAKRKIAEEEAKIPASFLTEGFSLPDELGNRNIIPGAASALDDDVKAQVIKSAERLNQLNEQKEAEKKQLEEAQQRRADAVEAERARLRAVAAAKKANVDVAQGRAQSASSAFTSAEANVAKVQTTDAQIFEAEKRTRAANQKAAAAPSQGTASSAAGIPDNSLAGGIDAASASIEGKGGSSSAMKQVLAKAKAAVSDGASDGELTALLKIIEKFITGTGKNTAKIEALKRQAEQQRAQMNSQRTTTARR